MKQNKKLNAIIPKEERKKIYESFDSVSDFHSRFFSKTRMIIYRITDIALAVALCVIFLVIFFVAGRLSNNFEAYLKEQGDTLSRASEIMFTVGTVFFGSAFLSVIFQLISNKDFFEKRQLIMFMSMKVAYLSHLEYAIGTTILFAIMVVCHLQQEYAQTILLSVYITSISILLVIRFIYFQASSDIKKYFLYSKSINRYFLFRKWVAIKQYRTIAEKYRNKDHVKEAIDLTFAMEKDKLNMFDKLLNSLHKKANLGLDVVNEQNILEEYLFRFVKSAYSPYQLIAVGSMMSLYNDKYISQINQNNNVKPLDYVANNLIDILNYSIMNKSNGFVDWTIDYKQVKWLPLLGKPFLTFTYNCLDIICVQAGYLASFKLMRDAIVKIVDKIPVDKKEFLSDKINNVLKRINEFELLLEKNTKLFSEYKSYSEQLLKKIVAACGKQS